MTIDRFETIGACPCCRASLRAERAAYLCQGCGKSWPIVRGVPRFVDSEHYVGSFGFQWRRHRTTQLDSRLQRESEETFAAKTGLAPEDVRGKVVLDVGVGTGRFSDVVARWGGIPFGVDLSLAVLSAQRNLSRYPESFVAQADLFSLPFKPSSFDIVFSIGVLHHTPSTRDAFRAIAPLVKEGGVLAVGLYEEIPLHRPSYDISERYRRYTTRLSHPVLHLLSHLAIPRHHLVLALDALNEHVAGRVRLALPASDHSDPQWRVLDTFDWYSPRYQWKHTEDEVRRWFLDLGFEAVGRLPERSMVSVRGRRPTGPLRTPPSSEELRSGALEPEPAWLPRSRGLRDLVLVTMLAGTVAWTLGAAFARASVHQLITLLVTAFKRVFAIEGDLLPARSRAR
ncbi:MAG TPA: class I SAM-dependent methyltransferase [Planctomycetota bacterium]|nr:class I SAM-dependent methyltransferase [Planctomycetota bacterium]